MGDILPSIMKEFYGLPFWQTVRGCATPEKAYTVRCVDAAISRVLGGSLLTPQGGIRSNGSILCSGANMHGHVIAVSTLGSLAAIESAVNNKAKRHLGVRDGTQLSFLLPRSS